MSQQGQLFGPNSLAQCSVAGHPPFRADQGCNACAAEQRRDSGIRRAGAHADHETPSWAEQAARVIGVYAKSSDEPFLIEDVLPYAKVRGLDDPPDGRAWGAATKKAKALGYIESCGYAPANTSNRSPKVLWRRKHER